MAVHDERFIAAALAAVRRNLDASELAPKTHALVRLGALLALGATPLSLQSDVEAALAAGASFDEIVGTLFALAPEIGVTHDEGGSGERNVGDRVQVPRLEAGAAGVRGRRGVPRRRRGRLGLGQPRARDRRRHVSGRAHGG